MDAIAAADSTDVAGRCCSRSRSCGAHRSSSSRSRATEIPVFTLVLVRVGLAALVLHAFVLAQRPRAIRREPRDARALRASWAFINNVAAVRADRLCHRAASARARLRS